MKKMFFAWALTFLCASPFVFAQPVENVAVPDTAKADAIIPNATVYFGYGAELTHQSKVSVSTATKIIMINMLSTSVDINSLQISVPEDVTLLSHKYSVFQPKAAPKVKLKEVERLEDSIKIVNKEKGRIDNFILIEQETLTKTGLLIENVTKTGGTNTISGNELLKLLEYYNSKIDKSRTAIYNHRQAISTLDEKISALQKRINEINTVTPVRPKPYGQVLLQVISKRNGEIPVDISYYTPNAGWTAMYDIRVNSKTNKVKMVYKASMTQTTGVDWKKTKLTLSTGTPNFGVTAPVLTPWYLQLYVPGLYTDLQRRAAQGNASRNMIQSLKSDYYLSEVIVKDDRNENMAQKPAMDSSVDPSTLQMYTSLNEGQLNTNFEIDLPYDIESDGQLHSVTIRDQEISCVLKNYAVPRIDKDAYLLAEVADWQQLDLLPGDANIIMDDTYVGKSVIDPNTTADTLNLSLGRDKRIAVKRSLVKEQSSLKTSGKESRQTFTYELIVKNNKLTDVGLILKDQVPLSTIKEVVVNMDDEGGSMYNAETGVLTWKLDLKPGESRKVRFSYTVKYPKDKKIINLK